MNALPFSGAAIWSARPRALRMVKGGAHHTAERIEQRIAPGMFRRGDRPA